MRSAAHLAAAACLSAACFAVVAPGCGYRSAQPALPGGGRIVRIALPGPELVDEPGLPRLLATELTRQLARSGIRVTSAGQAGSTLRTRILAVGRGAVVVDPVRRTLASQRVQLRLELRLEDRAGGTLWRSGILEVTRTLPLAGQGARSRQRALGHTLRSLAAQAARRAIELLTSGL